MAYAAALGDMLPCYVDTASQDGIVGHPLFSVGPDWPVYLSSHGLEGTQGNPYTAEHGFGIHGTHDASSIGKASSMGCIRLTDKDIEHVYAMLYPKWSKVAVRP